MKFSRQLSLVVGAFFLVLGIAGGLWAQEKFPSKPVTIFCGYSAGGSTDIQIRTVTPYVQKHLGQPVVVENLPGASGILAYNKVFSLKPDGYNLLVSSLQQLVLTEHFFKDTARYHTQDYTFIHNLVKEDPILVTHPDLYPSFEGFIQSAQKKKLKVGVPGKGQVVHLMVALLEKLAKVEFNTIPFEGGGPGMASLMGKHIDAFMTYGSTAFNMVRSGSLRPLLVVSKTRVPQYPQVPVPADLGYDTKETRIILSLTGIYGPPNIPPDIAKTLEAAFAKALKDPEYLEKVNKMNIEVLPLSAEEFRSTLEQEYPFIMKFTEVLKK